MHPALPRLRAPGPDVRLSGFAPGESVEPPSGVLIPPQLGAGHFAAVGKRPISVMKKAAQWAAFFMYLAERGGV